MTPVDRNLTGAVLAFDLEAELRTAREELRSGPSRMARTLFKEGPLRLTLVGLGPGGTIRPHQADAPVTIHAWRARFCSKPVVRYTGSLMTRWWRSMAGYAMP
jgi:hypothetical protein